MTWRGEARDRSSAGSVSVIIFLQVGSVIGLKNREFRSVFCFFFKTIQLFYNRNDPKGLFNLMYVKPWHGG